MEFEIQNLKKILLARGSTDMLLLVVAFEPDLDPWHLRLYGK
jgi:hypothetical protein